MAIQPNDLKHGIWWHDCIEEDCDARVMYDDEPWCYKCSPDEGSSLFGYSAHAQEQEMKKQLDFFKPGDKVTVGESPKIGTVVHHSQGDTIFGMVYIDWGMRPNGEFFGALPYKPERVNKVEEI